MAHIIALFGSGVFGGNCDRLLKEAVRGAEDAGCSVERINITNLTISPCLQTYGCMTENRCMIDDDAEQIIQKLKRCDGIIIASPIMTYGIAGALKCLMDRCQPFYMAQLRGTPFVTKEHAKIRRTLFISIAGMNTDDVFDGARATVKAFSSILSATYFDELLQNDMDRIRRVEDKSGLLNAAYAKGKRLGEALIHDRL